MGNFKNAVNISLYFQVGFAVFFCKCDFPRLSHLLSARSLSKAEHNYDCIGGAEYNFFANFASHHILIKSCEKAQYSAILYVVKSRAFFSCHCY